MIVGNGRHFEEFIDKCTARWLFEKTGVELYDAILEKCPDEHVRKLSHFRDEEKEHEEMLEAILRRYGADPHDLTPAARITQTESEGIVDVVQHEDFDSAMDALLNAELVDNAGWDLLISLAKEMGDRDAVKEFRKALRAEMQHLLYIRRNVIRTSKDKLHEQLQEAA